MKRKLKFKIGQLKLKLWLIWGCLFFGYKKVWIWKFIQGIVQKVLGLFKMRGGVKIYYIKELEGIFFMEGWVRKIFLQVMEGIKEIGLFCILGCENVKTLLLIIQNYRFIFVGMVKEILS